MRVDAEGICSVCRGYDRIWGDWNERETERLATLEKFFDGVRRKKRTYDVLVPLSGGKDSTYVLYLCRKQFDLKCLAVTWDNGFLTAHARENIRNAVDSLGVDHVYYSVNKELMMRLYRDFFLKTGIFCSVCMRGMQVAIERTAYGFGVPVVLVGTSRRTEEHVAPEFFENGDLAFFKEVLKGESLEEVSALLCDDSRAYRIKRALTYDELLLPDYLDWNYDRIFETISSELGWQAHREDAEHSDCKVDDIVHYMRYTKFPALVPEMLRFSKLVTAGQMTREEALQKVSENRQAIKEPDNMDWFLDTLGISREEMYQVLADPLRHMKYFKEPSRLWLALRSAKRKLLNPYLG